MVSSPIAWALEHIAVRLADLIRHLGMFELVRADVNAGMRGLSKVMAFAPWRKGNHNTLPSEIEPD